MGKEKSKGLDNQHKWTASRQKNDYDYSNVPVTRRDIRDFERRLLRRLTYRLGIFSMTVFLALSLLFFVVKS